MNQAWILFLLLPALLLVAADDNATTSGNATEQPPRDIATDTVVNDAKLTTQHPQGKRMCFPGLECVHGVCDQTGAGCLCDDGWQGPKCGIPKPSSEEGEFTADVNSSTSAPADSASEKPNNNTGDVADQWTPLEGFGPLPPLHLRMCDGRPQFVCRYGNCSEEGGMHCDCEPSFRGDFCENACTLDCGELARCEFTHTEDGETERCYCTHPGYYGANCTKVEAQAATGSAGSVNARSFFFYLPYIAVACAFSKFYILA